MSLGAAYLGGLVDTFSGSYVMAAAAYNAGPGRPAQWAVDCGDPRGASTDPSDFIECIPFAETRNYVMRIMEAVQVYRARLNGGSAPLTAMADLKRGAWGAAPPLASYQVASLGVGPSPPSAGDAATGAVAPDASAGPIPYATLAANNLAEARRAYPPLPPPRAHKETRKERLAREREERSEKRHGHGGKASKAGRGGKHAKSGGKASKHASARHASARHAPAKNRRR